MSEYKETAVRNIPKDELACLSGDSLWYADFIIKQLSSQLAERIMTVLSHEGEIVARLSDLRVEEYMPTNSVEYRRQINWSPLVRCKDCKWRDESTCIVHGAIWKDNDFCSRGERRTDEDNL